MKTKKITLATVRSFIRNNADNLFINITSSFDGMYDCCMPEHNGFQKTEYSSDNLYNTMGVKGAWFVFGSRDYFTVYNENGYSGIEVSNCCGHFILATR